MVDQSKSVNKKPEEEPLTEQLELSLAKEYAIYSDISGPGVRTSIDTLIDESQRLQLNTYQSFINNLFNPLSDHQSLFLIHGTGTGKTITSLSVAVEYQKQYREYVGLEKGHAYNDVRSVMVIGFTQNIFKDELISHPEFGFVSESEIAELRELQKTVHESTTISEKLQILKSRLYRRLSDRRMNGIFQFYGYRQLFNRVINADDLLAKMKSTRREDIDINRFEANQIRAWIRDGSVRLNKSFIETFRNCLLICDEVHNIYYQSDVNGYGLAIEIIRDYFNEPKLYNPSWTSDHENCIRWLFLSATPLASSPTEIIPIINLLNAKADRVEYQDLFDPSTKDLTSKGLELIARRIDGHISYIMDDNPVQYPSSSFAGVEIPRIPYLKFIRCPMSKEHQNVYDEYTNSYAADLNDESQSKGNTIKDFVFQSGSSSNGLLYRTADLTSEIKNGVSPYRDTSSGLLSSDLFAAKSLTKYSQKYLSILEQVIALKSSKHGKIFVYHPYVQSSGTNLIASIFKANGIIDQDEHPSDNSICMNCDSLYKGHNSKSTGKDSNACEFVPVRFVMITGYITKTAVVNRLNQFNSPENTNGERIKILVGSKAMRESHTLKACRHLMIAHQPSSVSELIQIIGRGVRKHSHSLLAPADRNIKLYIFVSSLNHGSGLSTEESDYYIKMHLYKQILSIERVLFNQSIDYLINFRFKKREVPKLIGEAFPLDTDLYNKYATMKSYPTSRLGSARSNSFYFTQELDICTYIIKRILFECQQVITKSDLTKMIRFPPFVVEADTKLISDEAIEYTLNDLCYEKSASLIIDNTDRITYQTQSLFDNSKLIIDQHGQQFCIKCAYLNNELILYLDSPRDPTNDLHKLITNSSPARVDTQIDLETLSNHWNDLVQIDEIIDELHEAYMKYKSIQGTILLRLKQFAVETHTKLIEYCIIAIIRRVFNNKKLTIDPMLLIDIVEYYQQQDMLITVKDTIGTIIDTLYKKYAIHTGSSWQDVVLGKTKSNRINYSGLPIGHYVKYSPKIVSPDSFTKNTITWNEYSSITQVKQWKYPYKLFGYYERGANIDSVFKVRDLTDSGSKGINPMFMHQKDLLHLAKRLKIGVNASNKKTIIVELIISAMNDIESKYRNEGKTDKILFHTYESIHLS